MAEVCIAPGKLADGTVIACRKCWQCRENRVNDWVGRCIAESKTALASNSITLTYGRDENGNEDHPRAKVLTYSDVQKYIKLLRRHGYPCRYFAIGEYGSMKGRAHWHLVLYWLERVPTHKLDVRFDHVIKSEAGEDVELWPHGYSHWTAISPASIRYNTKYIQKDIGKDERQGHLMMSKKPPLGTDYFKALAERYVAGGLAPQDLSYSFDEARDKRGNKIEFWLKGKTADVFLGHFVETWQRRHPARHMPNSELIEEWLDKQVRADPDFEPLEAREKEGRVDLAIKTLKRPPRNRFAKWMDESVLQWDEAQELWFCPVHFKGGQTRWYWVDDQWQVVNVGQERPQKSRPLRRPEGGQVELAERYRQQTGRI